jgi:hypothetical protein
MEMPRQETRDVCTPTLAGRIAAMLDLDPAQLDASLLPRGWHVALFTAPTRQSALRQEGGEVRGARKG